MSKKSILASCLLVALLAVAGFAQSTPNLGAITVVNQLPTTCAVGAQVVLQASSGAFAGQASGLYQCPIINTWLPFRQGAEVLEVLGADFSNTTATAATVLSYPINPYGVYQFQCTFFYTNSGTNAVTFTLLAPTSPTNVLAFATNIYAAAGTQGFAPLTGSPLSVATTAATTGTVYKETIEGTIENGATAGTLAFQASSATGTTGVKRGSYCKLR